VREKVLAVVPARYASTRFEGKVLAELAGRPVLQHVWENTVGASVASRVVIATEDKRVLTAARGFGAEAVLTSEHHRCGTERAAEVAARLDYPVVLIVQGDEPLIAAASLAACVALLLEKDLFDATTLATPLQAGSDAERPHTVKVVTDSLGKALYFSRAAIPFSRHGRPVRRLKHIGVYCYRKRVLLETVQRRPGPLELAEGLEQLRLLEGGGTMGVAVTPHDTVGIDVPEDLALAEEKLRSLGGNDV